MKVYYFNGNIKEKDLEINKGNFFYGNYFNESDTLIKVENSDLQYKFTFKDLLAFLELEEIPLKKGSAISDFDTSNDKEIDDENIKWVIHCMSSNYSALC